MNHAHCRACNIPAKVQGGHVVCPRCGATSQGTWFDSHLFKVVKDQPDEREGEGMGAQCKKIMIQGGPLVVKMQCEKDQVGKGLCTSHFVEMYGMSVKDFKALSHADRAALLPIKANDDDWLHEKSEKVQEDWKIKPEDQKAVIDEVVPFSKRMDKVSSLFADTLTLDFYKHPDLLKKLQDQADENFRTPEQQAMWIIADCVR